MTSTPQKLHVIYSMCGDAAVCTLCFLCAAQTQLLTLIVIWLHLAALPWIRR